MSKSLAQLDESIGIAASSTSLAAPADRKFEIQVSWLMEARLQRSSKARRATPSRVFTYLTLIQTCFRQRKRDCAVQVHQSLRPKGLRVLRSREL
jgi:hypothetical protein